MLFRYMKHCNEEKVKIPIQYHLKVGHDAVRRTSVSQSSDEKSAFNVWIVAMKKSIAQSHDV